MQSIRLVIIPMTYRKACEFIALHHRHHGEPRGFKFALGALSAEDSKLRGVATVGRPVARAYDDGLTAEVTRSCTDGTKNANSFLYAACWRVCREMGYVRLFTYIQEGETGVSLRAAGWKLIAERDPRKSWADSSVKLRHLRDPIGCGGISRSLWGVAENIGALEVK